MKYKKLVIVISFIVVSIVSALVGAKLMESKYVNSNTSSVKKKGTFTNKLSMMLETGSNTKEYELTTASEWPTSSYKFNSKLSICENGGSVSWDFESKNIVMEGSSSDKCYIYFDKVVTVSDYCTSGDNLAECIKTYGKEGYDKSSIYIHDDNLKYGAKDNSYRFAGASDYVNNYVCFGSTASTCPSDNLYRIIGVFGSKVKLIKADFANSNLLGTDGDYNSDNKYSWNYKSDTSINYGYGKNVWNTSLLNITNLNTNYLNNLGDSWVNMIDDTTWQVGGNKDTSIMSVPMYEVYQNEIVSPAESTTYNAKIGLMYVSDYGYAASSKYWTYSGYDSSGTWANNGQIWTGIDYSKVASENWLVNYDWEWTITRLSNYDTEVFRIDSMGTVVNGSAVVSHKIRPTFYLNDSINYNGGSGTKESPIRLESIKPLSEYVKSQYTQGETGLYLHNASLANSANDGSYRYAGSNPNNYICFGSNEDVCPNDNLYRIIGVFGDNVKLIKADFATSEALGTVDAYWGYVSASDYSTYKGTLSSLDVYYWNSSSNTNLWSNSELNTIVLNNNYIASLGDWKDYIVESSWQVGGNSYYNIRDKAMYLAYQNEIISPSTSTTYNAKIGLMYVSDYGYAASPEYWTYLGYSSSGTDYRTAINENWLYQGFIEWSITRHSSTSREVFSIKADGSVNCTYVDNYGYGVRPCFYLSKDVNYIRGTGLYSDPIRIN